MSNQPATFVPPFGQMDASIAFVGEQPGRSEVRSKQPFVGPAGSELTRCMASAGIVRSDCYFTNVIKDLDRPIGAYITIPKSGANVSALGKNYIRLLKSELEATSANVIVAVGNVALYALTERTGITKWRGSILESTLLPGRKVIPIIHPATVIPPKNVYTNKYLIMTDLSRVVQESAHAEIIPHDIEMHLRPTFDTIIEFLEHTIERGYRGFPVMLDIEVVGSKEINCISVAYDENNVISIPFVYGDGDYMTIEQEIAVWKILAAIIEDPKISIGGQNIIFDLSFILRKYGIVPNGPIYCTMIAQKILYPDFPVGLDFITSIYTRLPYYKADGKEWMTIGGPYMNFWQYNAYDSAACAIALPSQLQDLKDAGNMDVLTRKMRVHLPLMYMAEKGISVDTAGLMRKRDEISDEISSVEQHLWDLVGYQINYNSPKQIMHYMYDELGHQPYRKRVKNKWVPTSDEIAMKRLARKGVKEANLILQIRRLGKLKSTYLDLTKVSADSRMRCQYSPHKAKTGRYSSSADIFGEGINNQNIPPDILTYLLADPGCVFYGIDLSQIENRIVANVGRVMPMIKAFEDNIDVHRLTAGLIFNKHWEDISDEEGSCSLGDGTHSERDWGKKGNHSLNYDFGPNQFSLKFEIPQKEGTWIVNRYHSVYPEVRNVYHKMIKDKLSKDRTLVNLYGRKRVFLEQWGDAMWKTAYAHIPQSTTADKIDKEGMIPFYYDQKTYGEAELLIQIHDSIGFQIPLSIPWHRHAEILLALHASLTTPLSWDDREFVVPADITMGLCLNKHLGIEIKDRKIPRDPSKLATILHNNYKALTCPKENAPTG